MKYPDAGYDDVTLPARSFSTSKKKDSKKGCTQIDSLNFNVPCCGNHSRYQTTRTPQGHIK